MPPIRTRPSPEAIYPGATDVPSGVHWQEARLRTDPYRPGAPAAGRARGGPVSRRGVLAAAVSAAAAAGCSRPTTPEPGAAAAAGTGSPTGTAAAASSASWGLAPSTAASPAWASLAEQLTGRLYRPGDAGYASYRLAANPRYDLITPAAVARCAGPDDVMTAVRWARSNRVPFSVRSGGHCYGGWSTSAGLVVDCSLLSTVSVARDGASAVIGAGARLVDVYRSLAAAGVGVAAGSCPSVAMAGLTLGGGIGVLTRAWGLTCDSVTGLDVVTADGTVRRAGPDGAGDTDLLWASRGGGGGSFGIVTSFTVRTRPAPTVTVFFLRWPWSAAGAVLDAWQHWAPVADRRLWSTCKLLTTPAAPRVLVAGTWLGPPGALDAVLAPILAGAGAPPLTRTARTHGYLDAMLLEAGCRTPSSCHLPPDGTLGREYEAATSHLPTGPLSAAAVADLVALVPAMAGPPGLVEAGVSLDALGGAVADVAASATAFVHRSSPFSVQYTATWTGPASVADRFDALVRAARARLARHLGPGAYVNYPDAAVPDWTAAYWGANADRLRQVKRAVDPDDVFRFAQSVPR
ncbi:MAG TPA: FAD-binding oxidoreductase [Kineosporiaceae bacterium]